MATGPREDCLPVILGEQRSLNAARRPLSPGANAAGDAAGCARPRRCLGTRGPIRAVPQLLCHVPPGTAAPRALSCPGLKPPVRLKWVTVAAGGGVPTRAGSKPLILPPPPPVCRRPSEEMVKMVLSRPCHPDDQFTTSILRHWCIKHDDLLAEHIKSLLIKNNSLPRKRQR